VQGGAGNAERGTAADGALAGCGGLPGRRRV